MEQILNIKNKKRKDNISINLRKSVKSNYIIKTIFSFIRKDIKLLLFNFIKHFQMLFGFNLEDYKKLSGICKIADKNGFGKEYKLNTDIILFEGNYLNGKRNGKGKEFHQNGKIKFDGDYINGNKCEGIGYNVYGKEILIMEKNGKTKEYYDNGILKFEGEYLNGLKNRKAKKYYDNGILKFEGEYLNGKKVGKGKEYYINGNLKFEGEYINGRPKRKRIGNLNGRKKHINFLKDIFNRKGYFYDSDGFLLFEGIFLENGNGNIKTYNKSGIVISQEIFIDGKRKIKKFYENSNLKFEGEYLNEKRNCKGIEYYENGNIEYEGEYSSGHRIEKGKKYSENGELFLV